MIDGEPVAATEQEHASIRQIERLLETSIDGDAGIPKLVGADGSQVELPESILHMLRRMVHHLARGQVLSLVPTGNELTTQEAADLLNVSRPHLVKLLEQGDIPYTKTGTHRRVRFADLVTYKRKRDLTRRQGLDDLTRVSQELGLYDEQPPERKLAR